MPGSKDTPYSPTHSASRLMGAGTHHPFYDLNPLDVLAIAVAGVSPPVLPPEHEGP